MYLGNEKAFTATTQQTKPNKKSPIKTTFINTFKGLEELEATNERTYLVDR